MYCYTLNTIPYKCGTMVVYLYTNLVLTPLPTGNLVREIGESEESSDVKPGIQEIGVLKLSLIEDYTTYTEGFWYKVLGAYCEIRLDLTKNGVTSNYFWGTIESQSIDWTEYYIGSLGLLRCVDLDLVSIMSKLLDTLVSDWYNEIITQKVTRADGFSDGEMSDYICFKDIFSALLHISGLNATYLTTDTSIVFDASNPDLRFYTDRTDPSALFWNWKVITLNDIVIPVAVTGRPDSGISFMTNYTEVRSLLGDILRNFGLIATIWYDISDSRFKIKLMQRGRAYANASNLVLTAPVLPDAHINNATDLFIDSVRFTLEDGTHPVWQSKKRAASIPMVTAAPNDVNFDIDAPIFWGTIDANASGWQITTLYIIHVTTPHPLFAKVTDLDVYDYESKAPANMLLMFGGDAFTWEEYMQASMCFYFFKRFTPLYTCIKRRYIPMAISDGTTTTHQNAALLRRTSIDDGTGAAQYFASKVQKDPKTDSVMFTWTKE
jgi:hypothetical protein